MFKNTRIQDLLLLHNFKIFVTNSLIDFTIRWAMGITYYMYVL